LDLKSGCFPNGLWPGVFSSLCGGISLLLLVYSWVRGERQVFFLFIVFLFAFAALFPLALVRGAVP
jgi:hypothetical protein